MPHGLLPPLRPLPLLPPLLLHSRRLPSLPPLPHPHSPVHSPSLAGPTVSRPVPVLALVPDPAVTNSLERGAVRVPFPLCAPIWTVWPGNRARRTPDNASMTPETTMLADPAMTSTPIPTRPRKLAEGSSLRNVAAIGGRSGLAIGMGVRSAVLTRRAHETQRARKKEKKEKQRGRT